MINRITAISCLMLFVLSFSSSASAVTFYPIANIEARTWAEDLWPAVNLIQGPGLGFDANEPHDKTLGGPDGNWVTASCGFPCDYIETWGMPVLTLDLGEDRDLSEINVWGYASTNANGVSKFALRFATDADGPGGFGTSITFNPTYVDLFNHDTTRQTFPFGQVLTARFVEFTALDNFFVAPGDGSGGEIPGGDRVGLGEIAFPIPEPTTALLMVVGILMLALHRLPTVVRG